MKTAFSYRTARQSQRWTIGAFDQASDSDQRGLMSVDLTGRLHSITACEPSLQAFVIHPMVDADGPG